MKNLFLSISILLISFSQSLHAFTWKSGQNQHVVVSNSEEQVVKTALEMYSNDYKTVFDGNVILNESKGNVFVGTIGKNSGAEQLLGQNQVKTLSEKKEGFIVAVNGKNLIVLGSDKRGTAYGILELSRIIGVSPWEWWADSRPEKMNYVSLPKGYFTQQSPSVSSSF